MDCSVQQIVEQARDKLCLGEDLVLCEVKSSGGMLTHYGKLMAIFRFKGGKNLLMNLPKHPNKNCFVTKCKCLKHYITILEKSILIVIYLCEQQ